MGNSWSEHHREVSVFIHLLSTEHGIYIFQLIRLVTVHTELPQPTICRLLENVTAYRAMKEQNGMED